VGAEEETMQRFINVTLFCLVLSSPLLASEFQFSSFDIPGAQLTRPLAVNASGQIVGLYRDANNVSHGFLINVRDLPTGRYTQIDVPGATFTNAANINARGDIVGRWVGSDGYSHAYVRRADGQFTSFDPAVPCVVTRSQTVAHGINDTGDIVGRCFDSSGKELGFLLRHDGSFKILDYPGTRTTDAWMLNNREEIVGDYSDNSGFVHGYTWTEDGGFVTFDIPGSETSVRAITERGDIAGVYGSTRSHIHGYLLPKGDQMVTTVDYPGSVSLGNGTGGNFSINNSMLIVGGYIDVNGVEHGFAAIECPPSGCR